MLLAIDIGNTNVKLGVWDGQTWQRQWRLRTVHEKTVDEYGLELTALLRESALLTTLNGVMIVSVAPSLTPVFTAVSRHYLGLPALHVDRTVNTGIQILTDNPAQVGVDRIVNAAAAHHLYPGGPSIVIDMGTATKFDVVSGAGELLGGAIAPGLRVAADALASRAAQLSRVALEAPPHVIGRNTIHAMQSGIIFGYVSLIEGLVNRLQAEIPPEEEPVRIIGTGGLIRLIQPHTPTIEHVDPWLTLTGLRIIYDRVHE
jgi:type III pantothenate kinase